MKRQSTRVVLLDALPHVMLARLRQGEQSLLGTAQMLFGSTADVRAIVDELACRGGQRQIVVLDCTAALSFGEASRLKPLASASSATPFVLLASQPVLERHADSVERNRLPIVAVTPEGTLRWVAQSVTRTDRKALEAAGIVNGAKYEDVSRSLVNDWLTALAKSAIRKPPQGMRYERLSDGTWANSWIDVKRLLTNPVVAFEIAYHMAKRLTSNFITPPSELPFSGFVVGNNTALVLAQHVRRILGSPHRLFVCDRFGPLPHLSVLKLSLLERFEGQRLCVIEDVVGTGREVDLLSVFVFTRGGEITNAVGVFDLEIARTRLLDATQLEALCRPSIAIHYERLPSFRGAELEQGGK